MTFISISADALIWWISEWFSTTSMPSICVTFLFMWNIFYLIHKNLYLSCNVLNPGNNICVHNRRDLQILFLPSKYAFCPLKCQICFLQTKSRTARVNPHYCEAETHNFIQLMSQGHINSGFVWHYANQNKIKRVSPLQRVKMSNALVFVLQQQ